MTPPNASNALVSFQCGVTKCLPSETLESSELDKPNCEIIDESQTFKIINTPMKLIYLLIMLSVSLIPVSAIEEESWDDMQINDSLGGVVVVKGRMIGGDGAILKISYSGEEQSFCGGIIYIGSIEYSSININKSTESISSAVRSLRNGMIQVMIPVVSAKEGEKPSLLFDYNKTGESDIYVLVPAFGSVTINGIPRFMVVAKTNMDEVNKFKNWKEQSKLE